VVLRKSLLVEPSFRFSTATLLSRDSGRRKHGLREPGHEELPRPVRDSGNGGSRRVLLTPTTWRFYKKERGISIRGRTWAI
jgi:hypothetical protein